MRDWEQNAYKAWQQRRMEVYAAQIDRMDRGVGRILEKVRQVGVERNTLVMFLSDNGGCAEEIAAEWKGEHIPKQTHDGRSVQVGNNPNLMPGREDTYQSYGIAWANVSNTPFRLYKHWVHEGGIATPLIVYWPDGIKPKGLTGEIGHVIDIMATCLETAKTRYPANFGGYTLIPTEGKSLLPILQGRSRQRGPLCWEHEGNRAVRDGKWKLVARNGQPWELYDMEADRTELNDLAGQFPVIVKDMSKTYEQWAAATSSRRLAEKGGLAPWRRLIRYWERHHRHGACPPFSAARRWSVAKGDRRRRRRAYLHTHIYRRDGASPLLRLPT